MVKDVDARLKLVHTLIDLARDHTLQEKLSVNIKKLRIKDAADKIADLSLELITRK